MESIEERIANLESLAIAVLQRLAELTQERVADCMGVHPSTISRDKGDLERACLLLATLGFQVARTNAMLVDKDELRVMKRIVVKYLQADLEGEDGL